MKTVFAPHLGTHVKFGRKRPVAHCPRLHLKNYLLKSLPTPPTVVDYSAAAAASLGNVDLNDQLGDCVIAGYCHIRGVTSANSGGPEVLFSSSDIIKMYSAIGGYVPGNPSTDQGCDEQTALNYWTQHGGTDGSKLLGWLALDATNPTEYRTALWLFENLYFGIELPDAWINPMPSGPGFTWGVAGAPDPHNGHCIMGMGYSPSGVKVDTWGMLGTMTDSAIAKYCGPSGGGELYVLVSPDLIAKGQSRAPTGFDWSQLIADFDSLGGNIPIPAPSPAPGPIVPPVPPNPTPVPVPNNGPTQGTIIQMVNAALQATENALPQRYKQTGQQILNLAASKVDAAIKQAFLTHQLGG